MTCFGPTAAHDALDVRRMALFASGLFVRDTDLCRGCRERLLEMEMDLRPERRTEPVREAWPRLRRRLVA